VRRHGRRFPAAATTSPTPGPPFPSLRREGSCWGRRFPAAGAALPVAAAAASLPLGATPPVAVLLLVATAISPASALYSAGSPILQIDPQQLQIQGLDRLLLPPHHQIGASFGFNL